MEKRFFAAAALAIFCAAANAQCINGQQTIFHCTTEAKKIIQVCEYNGTLTYSFGKPKNNEIILSAKRANIKSGEWNGIGRWESYNIGIPNPNGDTVYSVFWARDRNSDAAAVEAGVRVETKGKFVATLQCDTRQPITQTLSPDGQAASAAVANQSKISEAEKNSLLTDFAEKCEAVLPFDLINEIDNRMYFGRTYWSGQAFNGPAVVTYMSGKELPTSTGRRMIFAPSKLGETKIKLQGGAEVTAKVYGAGDKECAAMADAIQKLPR